MKLHYILFIFSLSALFMLGCVNEDMQRNKPEVIDGIPATVHLKFELPEVDQIQTRAMEDKTISDLYVFSFKEGREGSFVAAQKYPGVVNSDKIQFKTVSGEQYIYAITNPTNDMLQGGMTETLDSYLKGCTRTQLFSLIATLGQNSTEFSNTTMLMSGLWKDDKGGTACTIKMDGTTTSSGKIELKRVGAKVNFSIKSGSGVSFTLEGYQVCEVPSTAPVFEEAVGVKASYFSTAVKNISTTDNIFSFYMLENKATGRDCKTEHDRELLKTGSLGGTPEDRDFANVDKPATYVLLHGRYKGPSTSQGKEVEAKVTYCIHLGKGAGASSEDKNDFNTNRNCNYTYTLTVNGVDNIIAEVTEEGKDSPREEGEVIIAGTEKLFRCDAHFDAREITFTKENLKTLNLNFIVKDPSTGNRYVTSDELDKDTKLSEKVDLSWVLFRNYINISPSERYKFPRDQSGLMKVDKLIEELKKWVAGTTSVFGNSSEEVTLTAFINEYYYPNMYWKDFVNTDDREMMIIYTKKHQQPANGNSSILTSATYMIQQRSIKTVYSQEDDYNAWGIESVNETGMLNVSTNPKSSGLNTTYGRVNMNVTAGSSSFATYLDYSEPQNGLMMKSSYQNAYYACLQRNRDEDGDGMIDQNEMKWYLPARGQYLSLWIGKTALTAEASIFNIDWNFPVMGSSVSTIPSKYHYVISDGNGYYDRYSGTWQDVFWAEEGITVASDGGGYASDKTREYRCVRDLNKIGNDEINLNNANHRPESIFKAQVDGSNVAVNLTYLNNQSLKPVASTGELDNHHERSEMNKPYKQFVFAGSVQSEKKSWSEWMKTTNPCETKGSGWRMPNQSELAILYMITQDKQYDGLKAMINNESVVAKTAYSGVAKNGSPTPNQTHAYQYNVRSNISLVTRSDSKHVRCVKDK